MLDGLLGRGFASKCKSLIKLTKSRIDVIRRKRNATQKFLKKDMADLLANGLDVNAYGRAEGLLVELTLSSCYDFVEQCCDFLLRNLSLMQKQSGCPEECREAVSSIMFAAARFSDLPELRDLRQAFQERYGDSLDYFLNQEFREKLASKPITMEKKVHLMQDIASEFSIKWNARNFEQRMAKASVSEQDQLKNNVYHATDDKYSLTNGKEIAAKGDKLNLSLKEPASDAQKFRKVREANSWKRDELGFHPELELSGNDRKVLAEREVTISRKDYQDTPQRKKEDFISDRRGKEIPLHKQVRPSTSSHEKLDDYVDGGAKHKKVKEKSVRDREHLDASFYPTAKDVANEKLDDYADGGIKHNKVKEKGLPNREHLDTSSHPTARDVGNFVVMPPKCEVKDTFFAGPNNRVDNTGANSMGKVKSEADKKSYYNGSIPPPYVKPNIKVKDDRSGANSVINSTTPDFTAIPTAPSMHRSPSWDQRSEDVQIDLSYPDQKTEDVEIARGNGHGNEKDYKYQDGITGYPLPKPKSHRRRHSKSRSTHDDAHHHEDDGTAKRTSRSRRREDQRRGLQVLFDDDRQHRDEEEKIIDKLLIHYSKKPSTYEDERIRRKSRSRRVNGVVPGVAESPLQRRERPEDEEEEVGVVPLPPRSISLPREQPSAPPLPTKVFARAASFQPDRSADARHVHPKLPDYDDLAARFAALKGR